MAVLGSLIELLERVSSGFKRKFVNIRKLVTDKEKQVEQKQMVKRAHSLPVSLLSFATCASLTFPTYPCAPRRGSSRHTRYTFGRPVRSSTGTTLIVPRAATSSASETVTSLAR